MILQHGDLGNRVIRVIRVLKVLTDLTVINCQACIKGTSGEIKVMYSNALVPSLLLLDTSHYHLSEAEEKREKNVWFRSCHSWHPFSRP